MLRYVVAVSSLSQSVTSEHWLHLDIILWQFQAKLMVHLVTLRYVVAVLSQSDVAYW